MMAPTPLILFIGRSPQALAVLPLLAACGYATEVAADGGAGILAAMTSAPHAVVIEVGIAHPDGLRTAHTLRTIRDLCDVPLLALSCGGEDHAGCTERLFDARLPPAAGAEQLRHAIDASLGLSPPLDLRTPPGSARRPARLVRGKAA